MQQDLAAAGEVDEHLGDACAQLRLLDGGLGRRASEAGDDREGDHVVASDEDRNSSVPGRPARGFRYAIRILPAFVERQLADVFHRNVNVNLTPLSAAILL